MTLKLGFMKKVHFFTHMRNTVNLNPLLFYLKCIMNQKDFEVVFYIMIASNFKIIFPIMMQ